VAATVSGVIIVAAAILIATVLRRPQEHSLPAALAVEPCA